MTRRPILAAPGPGRPALAWAAGSLFLIACAFGFSFLHFPRIAAAAMFAAIGAAVVSGRVKDAENRNRYGRD